jgi:hypothetical protein
MSIVAPRHRARALAVLVALAAAAPGHALPLAMTKEKVQKKAVIVTQDAKIFDKATGPAAKKADFMQLFFLLEGEQGGRVPVTRSPSKADPDGWLERASFAEWNTLQMINFEPQSGRELARIFDNAGCAEQFGRSGQPGSCKELGSEPQRTGKQKDNYSLLVPVLARSGENYQGGFVRVSAAGPVVKPGTDLEAGVATKGGGRLGYDLVLVIDSTASMQQWFRPTTQALDGFITSVQQQIGGGELKTPFRVGLLLYRDRKLPSGTLSALLPGAGCDIEYLFRWESELTDDIAAVTRALAGAREAGCGSDEAPESVYDALSRAVQDPKWNDGHFKVVLLVGDAPPHPPSNKDKNPLGLDVDAVTKEIEQRNIRIMSFKIGLSDDAEFKALALWNPIPRLTRMPCSPRSTRSGSCSPRGTRPSLRGSPRGRPNKIPRSSRGRGSTSTPTTSRSSSPTCHPAPQARAPPSSSRAGCPRRSSRSSRSASTSSWAKARSSVSPT